MIKRHLKPLVLEALGAFPAAAILGGRQVGKSTLAQDLASDQWPASYVTLDDLTALDAALRDPDGFVKGLKLPVIIDEIQRAPDLLRSIKLVVDRGRKPGMFLLTGSANLLTMKGVSESLAGRVAIFELHPLSWSELSRMPEPPGTLDALFSCPTAKDFIATLPEPGTATSREELAGSILSGGYPVPALMENQRNRTRWFQSYRETYLERDLRDISNVVRLTDFNRLLVAAASRTSQLLNVAELSRDMDIPVKTLHRHLDLLAITYQVTLMQPYFVNIGKRLVKTPKLYFNDTGMAAHLMVNEDWDVLERQGRAGALVETWVAAELRKLAALAEKRTEAFFWRPHQGKEVDFILARVDRLAALEVKWTRQVTESDLAGIENCRRDLGKQLGLSVVLHSGDTALAFNDHVAAVPLARFFGKG
jgi:uncharacterized protein